MAHAVTVQTEQQMPLVAAQPVVFTDLSPEVWVLILTRIFAPEDVANLNLVSKQMLQINQDPFTAFPRIQVLKCINSYVIKKFGLMSLAFGHPFPHVVFECRNIINYKKYITEAQKIKKTIPFLWIHRLSWFEKEGLKGQIWIANDRNDDGLGMQFGAAAADIGTSSHYIGHPDRAKYQRLLITVLADYISDLRDPPLVT